MLVLSTEDGLLGFCSHPGELEVSLKNPEAFKQTVFRKDVSQLWCFLGAANVYRRFIKDYSWIAQPFNRMISKDVRPDWDKPSDDQAAAFETIKVKLITPPLVVFPKKGHSYMIDTDASAFQLSAVLLLKQDLDDPKSWDPDWFSSKSFTVAERNYSPTERECPSVLLLIIFLRPYIEELPFSVQTGHDALRWLLTISDATGRLMRWRFRLSAFAFTITYHPSLEHQVPDAPSRILTPAGVYTILVDYEVPTYGDHEPVLITMRSSAEQERF